MRKGVSTMRKSFLLAVSFWMLASPAFSAEAKSNPLEEAILKANEYVQKKDYEKAVVEYERAVKIDPKSSKAYLLLGLTYANMGRLDEAVKNSAYSAILEPSYAAYHNLGLIYANKGDYDRASDAYEKALKMNDKSFRAWYEYGLLEAGNAHFDKAVECYKKSIQLNSQFADSYLGLGSASYWVGDKTTAIQQVEALRNMKEMEKAAALEGWINDKETRKSSGQRPAAPTAPVPVATEAAPVPTEPPAASPEPPATEAAPAETVPAEALTALPGSDPEKRVSLPPPAEAAQEDESAKP